MHSIIVVEIMFLLNSFLKTRTLYLIRLVYDRDTGKPKGYGFCEYVDVETAQSAMRNLNNHEFKGRQLRVGIAGGDFGREDRGKLLFYYALKTDTEHIYCAVCLSN